jgi:hypothetical protein
MSLIMVIFEPLGAFMLYLHSYMPLSVFFTTNVNYSDTKFNF